ncbi:uncharacterized protein LOC126990828 isoform X2 [Eriocheir sinensis]|uniref:uncharacterized protein LOC126990828 isoform X2 n=1 Tax=Eriocheir sinensis TaxID=95602 RepID=UPI0021C69373|nr:uncharacterized protein LOC126990828 isoform X2 [Eriocheir sinensis]
MQSASDIMYVYMARQGCRGASPSEPGMEMNDVIHVSADYLHQQKMAPESPNGWLLGTNIRTRQEGYFPGYFLMLNGTRRRSNAHPEPKPPLPSDSQPYVNFGVVAGTDSSPAPYGEFRETSAGRCESRGRRVGYANLPAPPPELQHHQHCLITVFYITPVLCSHCEYDVAATDVCVCVCG